MSLVLRRPDQLGSVAVFDPVIAPSPRDFDGRGVALSYGTRANFDRADPMSLLGRRCGGFRRRNRPIVLLSGGPGPRTGTERYRARLNDLRIPFVSVLGTRMARTWMSGWLPLAIAALAPEPQSVSSV